jgi:hypothetical protein
MRKDDERTGRATGDEAAPDELGNDPREVGPDSAGQSGDQPSQMLTMRVWMSWRRPIRLLRRQRLRGLKMRPTTPSVLYIHMWNTDVPPTYRRLEVLTEKRHRESGRESKNRA